MFGECEVSKNVLEKDHGILVKSFRAGHLEYNIYLVDILDSLNYLYNSSYSASDVLTHFPYQNVKGRSFSGHRSNVYEIPVTISDVFHDDPISAENFLEKADQWLQVLLKSNANNSPTVLLIHPNRAYKLLGQEYFISQLPESINIQEMNAFVDYWRARDDFDFETQLASNTLTITIPRKNLMVNGDISLIINNGQYLIEIIVQDENAKPIRFHSENWEMNDIILYNHQVTLGRTSELENQSLIKLYPNPVKNEINVEINLEAPAHIQMDFLDLMGKRIMTSGRNSYPAGQQFIRLNISHLNLPRGIYFFKIYSGINRNFYKKVILE